MGSVETLRFQLAALREPPAGARPLLQPRSTLSSAARCTGSVYSCRSACQTCAKATRCVGSRTSEVSGFGMPNRQAKDGQDERFFEPVGILHQIGSACSVVEGRANRMTSPTRRWVGIPCGDPGWGRIRADAVSRTQVTIPAARLNADFRRPISRQAGGYA
jgi:hypothetical protein